MRTNDVLGQLALHLQGHISIFYANLHVRHHSRSPNHIDESLFIVACAISNANLAPPKATLSTHKMTQVAASRSHSAAHRNSIIMSIIYFKCEKNRRSLPRNGRPIRVHIVDRLKVVGFVLSHSRVWYSCSLAVARSGIGQEN